MIAGGLYRGFFMDGLYPVSRLRDRAIMGGHDGNRRLQGRWGRH